jgi:hypothetical protein
MKNLHNFEEFLNEARLNEAKLDTREIEGEDMDSIRDALLFLSRGMGADALKKACKGKVEYTMFLNDQKGFPKPGGLQTSGVDFMANVSNPKLDVSEYIDKINGVLNDHGFDKFKVKINK